LTKTRRQRRLSKIRRERERLKEFLSEVEKEAVKKGFKSAEEYLLWDALRKEGIEAEHNVKVCGFEVDLFIRPNLIVEVGFLDDYLQKKWDVLEEKGYKFLYFSNLEIRKRDILQNTVRRSRARSWGGMVVEMEARRCWIYGGPCHLGRATCSDDCHEKLVEMLEREFGRYKKVVGVVTGKAYRVPTRDIIEKGLRYEDLGKYPEWV